MEPESGSVTTKVITEKIGQQFFAQIIGERLKNLSYVKVVSDSVFDATSLKYENLQELKYIHEQIQLIKIFKAIES